MRLYSDADGYKRCHLLGHTVVYSGKIPPFWKRHRCYLRNVSPTIKLEAVPGCLVLSPTRPKKQMKGRHFSSDAEVIVAAETWLDGQPSELYLNGLQKEFGRCSLFPSWSG